MSRPVILEVADGIARLTLANAANRNAVDKAFVDALADATIACEADASIRVIVMTAEGPVFSVGADLRAVLTAPGGPAAYVRYLAESFHESVLRLRAAAAPVVLGLNGMAAGGGFGLVCGADLAVMARSAVLTSAYTASGLTPDAGTTWFTPRLTGRQRAFDILATNPRLDAEAALAAGLVARVVDDDMLGDTLRQITAALLAQPEGTPAALKRLLAASEGSSLRDQLGRETQSIAARMLQPGVLARLQRFLKR